MVCKTEYRIEDGHDWIEVEVFDKSGTIHSNLKDAYNYEPEENGFINGFEATLLALACVGINLNSKKIQEAIQTVLNKIGNL